MHSLKKPYELQGKIQAPNSMNSCKSNGNLNVVLKPGVVMNGNLASRSDLEALGNDSSNLSESSEKTDRKRTNSNPKSPEIAKEFGMQGRVNHTEVNKYEGSTKSPKNIPMGTETQADEELSLRFIAKPEARRNQVVNKLLYLRDLMDNIASPTSAAVGDNLERKLTKSVEAVVYSDPANPPLSLLFLVKLLRDSYGAGNVNLKAYRHSSCQDELSNSAQLLNQPGPENSAAAGNLINISVIWKKVPNGEAQLLVQPTRQALIRGEANVARYFSRLLPADHPVNYDALKWEDVIRVDQLLENPMKNVDLDQLERELEERHACLLVEDQFGGAQQHHKSGEQAFMRKAEASTLPMEAVSGGLMRPGGGRMMQEMAGPWGSVTGNLPLGIQAQMPHGNMPLGKQPASSPTLVHQERNRAIGQFNISRMQPGGNAGDNFPEIELAWRKSLLKIQKIRQALQAAQAKELQFQKLLGHNSPEHLMNPGGQINQLSMATGMQRISRPPDQLIEQVKSGW